jgi:hypothetical protein
VVERLVSKPLPKTEVPQPNVQIGLELLVNHSSGPATLPDVTSTKAPQGAVLPAYGSCRRKGASLLASNTDLYANIKMIRDCGIELQCRPSVAIDTNVLRFAGFQLLSIRNGLGL